MQPSIQGTFHFHSTYSHDGRNTLSDIAQDLKRRGFSFCVMTEHFEDFDGTKFERYTRELNEVSHTSGFLMIPGIEVHLSGLDTILFPVRTYDEIARFALQGKNSQPAMFRVLAHASKYPFEKVLRHFETYDINGVEIWNQQEDGSYLPPFEFLRRLRGHPRRKHFRYFFGCDLHSLNLTVANVLSVPAPRERTCEAIIDLLVAGDFVSCNGPTGIEYRNGSEGTDFDGWLDGLGQKRYYGGRILRGLRRWLKRGYRALPRDAQHSLNNFKNYVRNKV